MPSPNVQVEDYFVANDFMSPEEAASLSIAIALHISPTGQSFKKVARYVTRKRHRNMNDDPTVQAIKQELASLLGDLNARWQQFEDNVEALRQ